MCHKPLTTYPEKSFGAKKINGKASRLFVKFAREYYFHGIE